MTWDGDNLEAPDQRDPDSLDAILGDAAWSEPDPGSVDRLRNDWAMINRRRVRVHRAWWLSAAALVGFAIASVAVQQIGVNVADRQVPTSNAEPNTALATNESESEKQHDSVQDESNTPIAIFDAPPRAVMERDTLSDEPTALERVLVTAVQRRVVKPRAESQDAPIDPFHAAIGRVVAQPNAEIADLCKPLLAHRNEMEQRLTRFIEHSQGARQLAAARLLAHIATYRSLPLLLELRTWAPIRHDATAAVARLANPLTLAQLTRSEPVPELQQRLLTALLERGNDQAVHLFLQFVRQPAMRDVAMRAASGASRPPLERLFAYLQGPKVQTRVAAARVLGQVNDPRVSQRLIHLVFHSQAGREALVALSTSHEPLAEEFVARAQLDLSLAASVHAARHRAASLTN